MNKVRLIVTFNEGEFMLLKDFEDGAAAINFAKMVGFSTYEVTREYNADDWVAIDPTVPEGRMSFAYNKNYRNYHLN
jgi:hypothetical protein